MFFEQEKCALWWMVLVAFVVSAAPGRAQPSVPMMMRHLAWQKLDSKEGEKVA